MPSELRSLAPLVRHPLALGLSLIDLRSAFDGPLWSTATVRLLEALLVSSRAVAQPAQDVRAIEFYIVRHLAGSVLSVHVQPNGLLPALY